MFRTFGTPSARQEQTWLLPKYLEKVHSRFQKPTPGGILHS